MATIDFSSIPAKAGKLDSEFQQAITNLSETPTTEQLYELQLAAMRYQIGVQSFSNAIKSVSDAKKEVTRNVK